MLWIWLAAWLLYLGLGERRVGSGRIAMALCWASFPVAACVFVVPEVRPDLAAGPEVRLLLWLGLALGLSGVLMWFRHRADDEHGDEGPETGEPPEPPWWPEFERDFRRYARRPRQRVG